MRRASDTPTAAIDQPISGSTHALPTPIPVDAPRVLIVGAGSRGFTYSKAISQSGLARVVAVAEPHAQKRATLGNKFIWGLEGRAAASTHEEFESWEDYVKYEVERRKRVAAGEIQEGEGDQGKNIDIAFVCVLDEMHVPVVQALAPFGMHIMCEKPLATSLKGCLDIYGSLLREWQKAGRKTVVGIGHVLRYSPHNVLLRKLLREDRVIGDTLQIEHTEPVGWWHYSHSYVRGNWRRENTTAPFLLTKSCHDLDLIFWLLCSPVSGTSEPPHLPSYISSTGSLKYFRKARKPIAAGDATNCLSCPIESSCTYSAKKIYLEKHLDSGNTEWPVDILVPEIEDILQNQGKQQAKDKVLEVLREDYAPDLPASEKEKRTWYGRCVWESDNTVCDDQCVTITWPDDPLPNPVDRSEVGGLGNRGSKTAQFHMVAFTEAICTRRGRIYGTEGEMSYDSTDISITNFKTGITKVHHVPSPPDSGHGGGDDELAMQMLKAVIAVRNGEMSVDEAQRMHLGCDLEEMIRSHAAVFAAEEARNLNQVVDWQQWWTREVQGQLESMALAGAPSDS